MDFSLASLSPEERAAMQESIRQKQRVTDLLRAAGQRANRHNDLAAIAQMAGNPGIAKAALLAQKNAQAEASPVQMGQQGFMLPDQGEFVESPMYAENKRADRDLRKDSLRAQLDARREALATQEQGKNERADVLATLRAQGQADQREYRNQTLALRELLGRRELESRAEREAAKIAAKEAKPEFKEDDIRKLGAFADKKQLPRLLPQARQLLAAIETAGDKGEVDGLGTKDQLLLRAPGGTRMMSKGAVDNHTAYQGILNALTRADAGLSQTQGEVVRQALETLNHPLTSGKTRAQVLKDHIIPILEQQRGAVLGTASPAALAEYRRRQELVQGDTAWLDTLGPTKAPPKKAVPAGLNLPPGFTFIGEAPAEGG